MTGHLNIDAAMRFSAEVRTPPVVLRDRSPVLPASGAVMKVLEGEDVIVGSKVAEDGAGVIVRLLNSTRQERKLTIDAGRPLRAPGWCTRTNGRRRSSGPLPRRSVPPSRPAVARASCSNGEAGQLRRTLGCDRRRRLVGDRLCQR